MNTAVCIVGGFVLGLAVGAIAAILTLVNWASSEYAKGYAAGVAAAKRPQGRPDWLFRRERRGVH